MGPRHMPPGSTLPTIRSAANKTRSHTHIPTHSHTHAKHIFKQKETARWNTGSSPS